MSNQSPPNHGEGNPEAADRFNTAERQFVNSPQGKQKVKEGPHVRPEEEAELSKAEQLARERSKGEDSGRG
jgi:hypothetical protein